MIMYMVQVQRSELRSCRSLLPRLRGQMVASGSNSCTLCWMMPDSTKANNLQLRMFYVNVHGQRSELRSCHSLLTRLRGQMVASGSNSCTLCWMMPDSTKANNLQLRMFYVNVHRLTYASLFRSSLLPRLRGQMVASGSNSCTLCWMMPDSTKANNLQLRMFYVNVHGQ